MKRKTILFCFKPLLIFFLIMWLDCSTFQGLLKSLQARLEQLHLPGGQKIGLLAKEALLELGCYGHLR